MKEDKIIPWMVADMDVNTEVRGIAYECGCVMKREKKLPIIYYDQRCSRHGNRIKGVIF